MGAVKGVRAACAVFLVGTVVAVGCTGRGGNNHQFGGTWNMVLDDVENVATPCGTTTATPGASRSGLVRLSQRGSSLTMTYPTGETFTGTVSGKSFDLSRPREGGMIARMHGAVDDADTVAGTVKAECKGIVYDTVVQSFSMRK